MNDEFFEFQLKTRRIKARSKVNAGHFGTIRPGFTPAEAGFKCSLCHVLASSEPVLSRVNNPNHCSYCSGQSISTCTRGVTVWLLAIP